LTYGTVSSSIASVLLASVKWAMKISVELTLTVNMNLFVPVSNLRHTRKFSIGLVVRHSAISISSYCLIIIELGAAPLLTSCLPEKRVAGEKHPYIKGICRLEDVETSH
jgi:hypothetical protein